MRFLRTNTACRVTVGPFMDKTDGITPETALTVTACKLTLMVDDGNVPTLVLDVAPTASAGSNDMVHVTGDDAGFYDLELAAANVNYLGRAMLAITDAANHCPVFHEFMIVPAMIYDSMFLGTDVLQTDVTQLLGTGWLAPAVAGTPDVNAKQLGGSTQSATDLKDFADTGYDPSTHKVADVALIAGAATVVLTDDSLTAAKIATDAIDAASIKADAVTKIQNGLATAAAVTSVLTRLLGSVASNGTIGTGNTTTSIVLPAVTGSANDDLNNWGLLLYDVSATRYYYTLIRDWTASSTAATVDTLPFTPENSVDLYWLLPVASGVNVTRVGGTDQSAGVDAPALMSGVTGFAAIAADAEEARASLAFGGATTVAISSIKGDTSLIVNSTVATTGAVNDAAASTTVFKTDLVAVDDFYNDATLTFTNGVLDGQTKPISDFAATNGTITLSEALTSAPANNVQFTINVAHIHPISQIGTGVWASATRTLSGTLGSFDALWTKIKKWLQLGFRKDAAIATDNATELTEINANGGSGAGAFVSTTDSLEAIRDNQTAGGGATAVEIRQEIDSNSTQLAALITATGTSNTALAKLDDTVENNAGTYRFTTAALANAPGGETSVTLMPVSGAATIGNVLEGGRIIGQYGAPLVGLTITCTTTSAGVTSNRDLTAYSGDLSLVVFDNDETAAVSGRVVEGANITVASNVATVSSTASYVLNSVVDANLRWELRETGAAPSIVFAKGPYVTERGPLSTG
jgi:hypothetical protein